MMRRLLLLQRAPPPPPSSLCLLRRFRAHLCSCAARSFSQQPQTSFPDHSSVSESSDSDSPLPEPAPSSQILHAFLRSRRARDLGRVREHGRIPAVLIDSEKPRRPSDGSTDVFLSVNASPISRLLKMLGKRDFLARVFDMKIYASSESLELKECVQVLPRNLNYGPGKTNILNIQFLRAPAGKVLKLGVRIQYLGLDKCPGLRKGRTLKTLAKFVTYKCKATELPAKIVVDMSVLEVGDRVLVQDLEVDFDLLDSDRLAPVCEIVKDEATVKSKVKRLKNELYFKKKALAEKEGEDAPRKEKSVSDQQASDSEDAKEDGEEDGQDDVEPRIGKVLRGFLKTRPSSERSDSQDKPKNPKFQKRRLVGTSLPQKEKYKRVGTGDSKVDSTGQKDVPKKMVSTRKKGRQRTEVGKSGKAGNGKWTNTSKKPKTNSAKVGAKRKGKV